MSERSRALVRSEELTEAGQQYKQNKTVIDGRTDPKAHRVLDEEADDDRVGTTLCKESYERPEVKSGQSRGTSTKSGAQTSAQQTGAQRPRTSSLTMPTMIIGIRSGALSPYKKSGALTPSQPAEVAKQTFSAVDISGSEATFVLTSAIGCATAFEYRGHFSLFKKLKTNNNFGCYSSEKWTPTW